MENDLINDWALVDQTRTTITMRFDITGDVDAIRKSINAKIRELQRREHTKQCEDPKQTIERHLVCKCWCHRHRWYPETLKDRKEKVKQIYKNLYK